MRNYVKHLYSVSVIGIMHGLPTHTAVGGSKDGEIMYGLLGLEIFRVWPDPWCFVQIVQYLDSCNTIQIYAVCMCFYSYSDLKHYFFTNGMDNVMNGIFMQFHALSLEERGEKESRRLSA